MGASFTVLGGSFVFCLCLFCFKYELKRIATTIIITPPTGTFVKYQLAPAGNKTKATKGNHDLVSCGASVIDSMNF